MRTDRDCARPEVNRGDRDRRAQRAVWAAVVCGVAWLGAGRAPAEVITVPGDFASVGAALWAAAPYDTVLVSPGVYLENIVWPPTPRLALISTEGPQATILDGRGLDQVVGIYVDVDSSTVIRGFTLRNGHAAGT